MKKCLIVAAAFLVLQAPSIHAKSGFSPQAAAILQEGLVQTADSFILPGYQTLATSSASLTDKITSHCKKRRFTRADPSGFQTGLSRLAKGQRHSNGCGHGGKRPAALSALA